MMRHALAAAALLTAFPALAQRIDTGVQDVVETADGFTCHSHAYPELRLTHDWRDGDRSAVWESNAREAGQDEMRMRVSLLPDTDKPFGTAASVVGFQLEMEHAPLKAAPRIAHLRLDGAPDGTVINVDGDASSVTLAVGERQREDLAARLMRTDILQVDLADASGAALGRFSWDVRKLRRAPELLQVINWSCRQPE